ncbi:MAG TPA: Stp1/IreP family PP2C-type Ser/Thr phosphatase [Acidimicrobiia bacterium]|nr:Stp1/IreP family PP2C-type Ser/Thr phosphatase [Acidimicrobiia bacterium]
MRVEAAGATNTGRVREGNEDSFLVDDRQRLFAVADGMGGHQGGEVASATAVEALRASVASGRAINDAIRDANIAVFEKAVDDPGLEGMGTTMTALVAPSFGDQLLIGHVGDSRAYLLRDGELSRLTDDHSLVEELVREGRLTPEQAEVHPQRAIITRALGVDGQVEVDVYTITVRTGDRVVLCSDGLTTMVRDRDVERMARAGNPPQRTAEELIEAANQAGGEDNITVVVVDVLEVETGVPAGDEFARLDGPVTPAPIAAPDVAEPEPTTDHFMASRGRRMWGLVFLVVPLAMVLGVAVGGLYWYARQTYYVGIDDGEVVVFRGIPGGVLGWSPTVEQRTDVAASELREADRRNLEDDGAGRGSLTRAREYLRELLADTTTTTTSTTTTTTTRPTVTTRALTSTTRSSLAGVP